MFAFAASMAKGMANVSHLVVHPPNAAAAEFSSANSSKMSILCLPTVFLPSPASLFAFHFSSRSRSADVAVVLVAGVVDGGVEVVVQPAAAEVATKEVGLDSNWQNKITHIKYSTCNTFKEMNILMKFGYRFSVRNSN
jgi:hypothetical protein